MRKNPWLQLQGRQHRAFPIPVFSGALGGPIAFARGNAGGRIDASPSGLAFASSHFSNYLNGTNGDHTHECPFRTLPEAGFVA